MSTATRVPLRHARVYAEELLDLLMRACERIQVAGSVRRQRPDVGDIEILATAVTRRVFDMFGEPNGQETNKLDEWTAELRARGVLQDRLDKNGRPAWGSKYKRALYRGVAVDLFIVPPSVWGMALLIRTGPRELSHAAVTPRTQRLVEGGIGLLPAWAVVQDGFRVYHRESGEEFPMPEEADAFQLLDLDPIPPEQRDAWWAAWVERWGAR